MPKWTEDELAVAVSKVNSKQLSLRKAAIKYDIPYATLRSHVRDIPAKVGAGRPTVLTHQEEEEIVYTCQVRETAL